MPKPLKITEPSTDTGGMATITYGDASAIGENTLTSVNVSVHTNEHLRVTISNGKVMAVAEATSPDGGATYAATTTDAAFSGADLVISRTTHQSGSDADGSYDVSAMNFKAIDLPIDFNEPLVVEIAHDKYDSGDHPIDLQLQGNVAISTFDSVASGNDTLVAVDAYALAIEDELSLSTVMITSAVG